MGELFRRSVRVYSKNSAHFQSIAFSVHTSSPQKGATVLRTVSVEWLNEEKHTLLLVTQNLLLRQITQSTRRSF